MADAPFRAHARGAAVTAEHRLRRELKNFRQRVLHLHLYVDTVSVLLPSVDDTFSLSEARPLNGGPIVPDETKSRRHYLLLRIHQPTQDFIDYMMRAVPHHIVVRVDLAVDFAARNVDVSNTLLSFIYRHVVHKRRGHGLRRRFVDRTTYSREAGAPVLLATYPRLSKFSRHAVAHMEARFSGRRKCKSRSRKLLSQRNRL